MGQTFCDKQKFNLDKEKTKKIITFFLILSGCLLCCLLMDFKWGIHYAINDDVAMREIVSGIRSGVPDGHAVYIKYPLGWALMCLYKVNSVLDWYGMFMLGTVVLSWALVLYRVFYLVKSPVLKIGLMGMVTYLFIGHIFALQWTMCAAISGVSAVMFYLTVHSEDKHVEIFEKTISIFLLVICYVIRDKVFWLVAACSFFSVCYKEFTSLENKKEAAQKTIKIFGFVLLMIGAVEAIDVMAYSNAEWKSYFEFNRSRSLVYDYYGIPDYDTHRVFYESEEIPRTTYENLNNYGFIYDENVDTELLSTIADYSKTYSQTASFKENIYRFLGTFFHNSEFNGTKWIMCVLSILIIYAMIKKQDKQLIILCIGQMAVWCALVLYLVYQGRFPNRIIDTLCLIFIFIFASVCAQYFYNEIRYLRACRYLFTMLSLVVCLISFRQLVNESKMLGANNIGINQIKQYANEHEDNLYFLPSASFARYTDDFDLVKSEYKGKILPTGGWGYKTPVTTQRLQSMGLETIPKDLVSSENVYFLDWSDVSVDYIVNSIENNLQCDIECKIVDVLEIRDGNVNVYSMDFKY